MLTLGWEVALLALVCFLNLCIVPYTLETDLHYTMCIVYADFCCIVCFRLAAETLAGLNNMQPRSSGDHPETASASLDHSSSESPAAARRLSKQSLHGNRKQRPHNVKHSQRPVMQTASAASVHASTGGVSVHPVLGLYVPHARRSYHREGTAAAVKAAPTGTIANQGLPFALARPKAAAPALGRRRKGPDTGSGHVKATPALRRMPSDSSMTVSADSGGN